MTSWLAATLMGAGPLHEARYESEAAAERAGRAIGAGAAILAVRRAVRGGALRVRPGAEVEEPTRREVKRLLECYSEWWLRVGAAAMSQQDVVRGIVARRNGQMAAMAVELVVLLDGAKADAAPGTLAAATPLFKADAALKSSAEIAAKLAAVALVGEGNLPRHLGTLGAPLRARKQQPADEFDSAAPSLRVDLRNGLLLARVADLMPGSAGGVLAACQQHAASKDGMVANMALVLRRLGLPDVDPEDIVNGRRVPSLQLLWTLAQTHMAASLVGADALVREAQRINRRAKPVRSVPKALLQWVRTLPYPTTLRVCH